ncbi:hypothetical protein HAX54_042928 [Datura stramonium]|uniref:FF domain-containing protein n=1 Tax=Datura stramonium TaxID=4076 RepID=A0ABS8SMN8_DATST|nr:hypothetical protein [Datura stramonium]
MGTTMRVIINDKRYGALKTLGFHGELNAYLYFLLLSTNVHKTLKGSPTRGKAVTMFEDDERFKAVERGRVVERSKAQEEYRRNRLEYKQFLETCGFIKVDTQWRKVQDLLEDDERCSRLEKLDRLEIFQEYIRDLEKEDEEQRKLQKGQLTAKTSWRDYCQMVKESVAYEAVTSNAGFDTKRICLKISLRSWKNRSQYVYHEDKIRVKDVVKSEKITISSTWTLKTLKLLFWKESVPHPFMMSIYRCLKVADLFRHTCGKLNAIPSIVLLWCTLIFEDLIERAKEKEEKEAKKRQRLAKDFTEKLSTIKEITDSSSWEECKELVEDSSEFR